MKTRFKPFRGLIFNWFGRLLRSQRFALHFIKRAGRADGPQKANSRKGPGLLRKRAIFPKGARLRRAASSRRALLALLAALFYILAAWLSYGGRPAANRALYFAPPEAVRHFAFGFREAYADLFWIRLLQDVDFCGGLKPVYESKQPERQCEKGWSYRLTDAITELAPRFLTPYLLAPPIMSVVMKDRLGAKHIYDKGVKRFPDSWSLLFYAGYHYMWELKDEHTGTELLLKAGRAGGPSWLYYLAAKKYRKFGRLLAARNVLLEFAKKNPPYKKFVEKKLLEIEKEIKSARRH